MDNAKRKSLNAERLLLVDETIRPLVAAVLSDLEAEGHSPLIAAEVWRSPELQLKKFRQGVSKARWGYHCFTRKGKPASLAADVVDADKGWNMPLEFWMAIGRAAKKHGLGWGGYFGLNRLQRLALMSALGGGQSHGVKVGWDLAHVEVQGMTLMNARAQAT